MNIGPPVEIEIDRFENGQIDIAMYDASGLTCGGVTIKPDGTILAALLTGNNRIISTARLNPN